MKKFMMLSASACLCLSMALGSMSIYGSTKTITSSTKTSSVGTAEETETTTAVTSANGLKTEKSAVAKATETTTETTTVVKNDASTIKTYKAVSDEETTKAGLKSSRAVAVTTTTEATTEETTEDETETTTEETSEATTEQETETTTKAAVIGGADTSTKLYVIGEGSDISSKYFTDVNEDSYGWSAKYVDDIASRGIASGIGHNLFNPGGTIIRGDFAVFLSRTFSLPNASGIVYGYSDVDEDSYYHQYIINCRAVDIFDNSKTFFPDSPITRGNAMLYIYRGLLSQNLILGNGTTDCSMYEDGGEITDVELQLAVGTLSNMGIVKGSDGRLNLQDTMTRAEMASIFSQTCSYIDKAKTITEEKEQAKKEKEEAEKQAEQEIVGNDFKKATVTETKSFSGEDASFTNCTIDFASQDDNLITMSNGTLGISGTTIKSYGYDAVVLSDSAKASVDSSTISASEGNSIQLDSTSSVSLKDSEIRADGKLTTRFGAVVNGGTLTLDNTKIKTGKFSALSVLGGSTIDMSNGSELTVTEKGVSPIVVSGNDASGDTDDTNVNSTDITIDASKVTSEKASLFQIKDCVVNAMISNSSEINCDSIINSTDDGIKQTCGSTFNLTLKNQELTGDIKPDYDTEVNLNVGSGSVYTGAIDPDSRQTVSLTLAADAQLVLTGTSYVDGLVLEDYAYNNLNLGGNILYYNINNPVNDYLQSESVALGSGELVPYSGPQ